MRYCWRDCSADDAAVINGWMDSDARYFTGCDDGWDAYVTYMLGEDYIHPSKNFWCTVISAEDLPIAAAALYLTEGGSLMISELVIRPEYRGRGHGRAILTELLTASDVILGCTVRGAEAAIYPDNPASIRAFEGTGFRFSHAHPDADVFYYRYDIPDPDV